MPTYFIIHQMWNSWSVKLHSVPLLQLCRHILWDSVEMHCIIQEHQTLLAYRLLTKFWTAKCHKIHTALLRKPQRRDFSEQLNSNSSHFRVSLLHLCCRLGHPEKNRSPFWLASSLPLLRLNVPLNPAPCQSQLCVTKEATFELHWESLIDYQHLSTFTHHR